MVNVAILGTGFGKEHARIYDQLEDANIVGIFGRNPERLHALEVELGARTTTDIDNLISDPTVDLVDICLPTALHARFAMRALEAGKHVYVETPVALSVAEAEQMKQCAADHRKRLFVDLFLKFSPPHKYAIDAVKSGALGRPLTLTSYNRTPPIWGNLGLDRIVLNFMLHNFDLLASVMGIPRELSAVGVGRDNGAHVASTMSYPGGFAVVESSSMMPPGYDFDLGFTLTCEGGTITHSESNAATNVYYEDGEVEPLLLSPCNEWKQATEHVLECIDTGADSPYLDIEHALASLCIAEATNQSRQSGRPVTIQ